MRVIAAALALILLPSGALAYCSEPYARFPSKPETPGSYSKPLVPYCLSSMKFSGTHTCDSWEIDSYKREVEDYIDKLQTYADDAYAAARDAAQFARDAEAYAKCEAEDVASQHK